MAKILAQSGRQCSSSLEEKIKRLEEETTNCISSLDELGAQNNRLENKLNQKLQSLDGQIKKQI